MSAAAFLRADLRRVSRDPAWLLVALLPPLLALGLRAGFPALAAATAEVAGKPLPAEGAAAFLLLLTPVLLGMVAGMMTLDDREENVLLALSFTPAGKTGLIRWRLAVPALWSALMAGAVVPLSGLAQAAPLRLLPLALLAASQAVLVALLLPAFAGNRLEAMALAKAASGAMFVALATVFLPPPWLWAGAPNPQFWTLWLFLHRGAPAGGWLLACGAAAAVHLLLAALLLRAFRRRVG